MKEVIDFYKDFTIINNGHVLTMVGYDDVDRVFIIANSYGASFGDNGFFYIDYDYFISNKKWPSPIYNIYGIHKTTDQL